MDRNMRIWELRRTPRRATCPDPFEISSLVLVEQPVGHWGLAHEYNLRRRLAKVRERLRDCSVDDWYQLHQEREELERKLGEVRHG